MQSLLNGVLKPSPQLPVDGDFGQKTHEAVVRFQKTRHLTADGVVGAKTWAALGQPSLASAPKQAALAAPAARSAGGADAPWMDIAFGEEGQREEDGAARNNSRIVEYHGATSLRAKDDETPWCSSFVNWVMKEAGYTGTNNALAKSWLDWGETLDSPRYGAITVIKRKGAQRDAATGSSTGYHVAFYVDSTSTHIELLGGNQGDSVKRSKFSLGSYEVCGYRWPR
ncbi:TIGR02594 family protein [Archangium violaceum]|uniref:NlpC/P60 family protein n=1 Tax=Archangium violaceum TaxID=83451 RepID=UPI00194F2520|nr:TIGR02594 family protein [Archangium violaceum]QRN96372.1 TIGR02594 family protein [Archangium violaceum]